MPIRVVPPTIAAAVLAAAVSMAVPASAAANGCLPTDRSGAPVNLTRADNGRTVCLLPGQRLTVTLTVDVTVQPNPANWWKPIGVSGTALTQLPLPAPSPPGVTQANFKTTGGGSSVVTSYLDVCPPGYPCGAPLFPWRVTAQAHPE